MNLKNRVVIAISFLFCSLNCFLAWIASFISVVNIDRSIVIPGVIMAIMIPISFNDPREKMRDSIAALSSVFLHILFNLLVIVMFSLWWLATVFVFETIILLVLYYFTRKHK